MLPRVLQATLERAAQTFPAIIVTGPRQSGKTTLLRSSWGATHRFVSLENPDTRDQARADPNGFLREHPAPVILDEIQYVPELLSYVKTAIDADRAPGRFLLTGSQSFALMQGVTQSLAGRAAVVSLLPFSPDEAVGAGGRRVSLDELLERQAGPGPDLSPPSFDLADWLLRGGYPEIRANPMVDRALWCASYLQTYLERDVRQLLRVGDLATFERFLRLAAARTGQVLNASELARDVGISPPTVRQWLSVLEASGVVHLIQPYFHNFGKRVIKSPKLYFVDTALATFLIGLHSPEALMKGPSAGAMFETAFVASWIKAFLHRGEPPSVYYWRSRDGLEVDLIVERNGRLHAFEAKATATVTPRHAHALLAWRQLVGPAAATTAVVANVDRPTSIAPGVRAVPWWWS